MNRDKRIFLVILLLLATASTGFAQKKQAVKEYTIEQFMNTVRIGGASFSSDEKSILFHNNKSGIFNVYSVPVTGGAATQLTSSTKESTFAVTYFPNDARSFTRTIAAATRTVISTCASPTARNAISRRARK